VSGVPLLVEGGGLRVLVVGAGAVATRKLLTFVEAGARVTVVAPRASDEVRALGEDGRISWLPRTYVPADIDDAQLVLVATDDRTVNARASADARAMLRMVNVADAPDDGSFTMMATHRSGTLVVGVSAGGVPAAAARIRDVIARRFDERYARALDTLVDVRRTALASGEGARWRTFSRAVLGRAFCRDVEAGTLMERVGSWR
jgi:precorrin-2 dehydrogenase/sirohydrochlorin ferrochelatase